MGQRPVERSLDAHRVDAPICARGQQRHLVHRFDPVDHRVSLRGEMATIEA